MRGRTHPPGLEQLQCVFSMPRNHTGVTLHLGGALVVPLAFPLPCAALPLPSASHTSATPPFPVSSQVDPAGQVDHPLNMMPTDDRLPAEQLIANAVSGGEGGGGPVQSPFPATAGVPLPPSEDTRHALGLHPDLYLGICVEASIMNNGPPPPPLCHERFPPLPIPRCGKWCTTRASSCAASWQCCTPALCAATRRTFTRRCTTIRRS